MCDRTMRNGIRRLEAVLSYGLDGHSELLSNTAWLAELGLNPDTFFESLYVSRPQTEEELFTNLRAGTLHAFLVGPIGCGKTTMLHRVTRAYSKHYHVPCILIDFKTLQRGNPTEYEFAHLINDEGFVQSMSFLSTFNTDTAGIPLEDYLQPTQLDLINILLEPQGVGYLTPEHQQIFQQMRTEARLSRDGARIPVHEWIIGVLANNSHPSNARIQTHIRNISHGMTFFEAAYATCELARRKLESERESGKSRLHKLIVAFDNVDAIDDLILRDQVVAWMRDVAPTYTPVATFVSCVRPQNLHRIRQPASEDGTPMWGDDGTPILKLSVGEIDIAEETITSWERLLESDWYDSEHDDLHMTAHLTETQRQRLVFDDMIHVKRIEFVAKVIESGRIEGVSLEDLQAVSSAAQEVLRNRDVRLDISMQANGNRRVLLSGVANFLEYVVRELDLEWKQLGNRRKEVGKQSKRRGSVIKSLYYRFMGSAHPNSAQPPIFEPLVFDPVSDILSCGWKGRRLPNDVTAESVATQCSQFLVMMAVYNACGNTLDYWSGEAVTVRSVAANCKRFGLARSVVYRCLEQAIRAASARFAGFFEIDHFHAIRDETRDIDGSERIVATDRCRRMVSHNMYMFNYLCERIERLDEPEMGNRASGARLLLGGLVSEGTVKRFPEWLAKFVVVETWLVEAIEKTRPDNSLKGAFEEYGDFIVVKRTHSEAPSLISKRMAFSALAYLEFAKENHILPEETDLLECYDQVSGDLRSIVKKLKAIAQRIGRGETWNIPRDEALRY